MLVSKELTIYDSWNLNYPPIPARSRLFPLEPIGIGTPYVESLTSYLTRLAEAHTVHLGVLASKEIKPVVPKSYKSKDLFGIKHHTGSVNGTGTIATDVVQALEKLTMRNELASLTLLRWSHVFPQRQLNRHTKAWRPVCYQNWYSNNKTIYDPLMWSFQAVDICLEHKIPLQTYCPSCLSELPPLANNSRPGYCSKLRAVAWEANSSINTRRRKMANLGNS